MLTNNLLAYANSHDRRARVDDQIEAGLVHIPYTHLNDEQSCSRALPPLLQNGPTNSPSKLSAEYELQLLERLHRTHEPIIPDAECSSDYESMSSSSTFRSLESSDSSSDSPTPYMTVQDLKQTIRQCVADFNSVKQVPTIPEEVITIEESLNSPDPYSYSENVEEMDEAEAGRPPSRSAPRRWANKVVEFLKGKNSRDSDPLVNGLTREEHSRTSALPSIGPTTVVKNSDGSDAYYVSTEPLEDCQNHPSTSPEPEQGFQSDVYNSHSSGDHLSHVHEYYDLDHHFTHYVAVPEQSDRERKPSGSPTDSDEPSLIPGANLTSRLRQAAHLYDNEQLESSFVEPLTEVQLSRLLDDVNLKPSDKAGLAFTLAYSEHYVSQTVDLVDFLQGPTLSSLRTRSSPEPEVEVEQLQRITELRENSTLAKILFEEEEESKPSSPFLFYDPPEKSVVASLTPAEPPVVNAAPENREMMHCTLQGRVESPANRANKKQQQFQLTPVFPATQTQQTAPGAAKPKRVRKNPNGFVSKRTTKLGQKTRRELAVQKLFDNTFPFEEDGGDQEDAEDSPMHRSRENKENLPEGEGQEMEKAKKPVDYSLAICKSLVRKLDKKGTLAAYLEMFDKPLEQRHLEPCFTMYKCADGRIQVHVRKFQPNVAVARVFRFPRVRQTRELRSTSSCQFSYNGDAKSFLRDEFQVCINPWHLELVGSSQVPGPFPNSTGTPTAPRSVSGTPGCCREPSITPESQYPVGGVEGAGPQNGGLISPPLNGFGAGAQLPAHRVPQQHPQHIINVCSNGAQQQHNPGAPLAQHSTNGVDNAHFKRPGPPPSVTALMEERPKNSSNETTLSGILSEARGTMDGQIPSPPRTDLFAEDDLMVALELIDDENRRSNEMKTPKQSPATIQGSGSNVSSPQTRYSPQGLASPFGGDVASRATPQHPGYSASPMTPAGVFPNTPSQAGAARMHMLPHAAPMQPHMGGGYQPHGMMTQPMMPGQQIPYGQAIVKQETHSPPQSTFFSGPQMLNPAASPFAAPAPATSQQQQQRISPNMRPGSCEETKPLIRRRADYHQGTYAVYPGMLREQEGAAGLPQEQQPSTSQGVRHAAQSNARKGSPHYQHEADPSHWALVMYYEYGDRISEPFKASMGSFDIDGFTSVNEPNRFCIGAIGNPARLLTAVMVRRQIGKGIRISRQGNESFTLDCHSDSPVFVQAPLHAYQSGDPPSTVYRITNGHSIELFNRERFEKLVQLKRAEGFSETYNLQTYCHSRISFVKGFGADYRRRLINSTPAWVEVHFLEPLQLLDKTLASMEGPLEPASSFT